MKVIEVGGDQSYLTTSSVFTVVGRMLDLAVDVDSGPLLLPALGSASPIGRVGSSWPTP